MAGQRGTKRTPNVEYNEGADGRWYWSLFSGNGKITSDGSEGYATKSSARRGFKAAQRIMRGEVLER